MEIEINKCNNCGEEINKCQEFCEICIKEAQIAWQDEIDTQNSLLIN